MVKPINKGDTFMNLAKLLAPNTNLLAANSKIINSNMKRLIKLKILSSPYNNVIIFST